MREMWGYRDDLGPYEQFRAHATVMEQARNAGATIVKQAHDTFWGGYAGYFSDPDGHLWEIVWNPLLQTEE